MGLGSLVLGDRNNRYLGVVKINLLTSERISLRSAVTKEAIELGYDITDNIILEPYQIDLSFYVSDYSIVSDSVLSKASSVYTALSLQRSLRLPTLYVNDLDVFTSCVITAIAINRGSDNGIGLPFDVTLQEVTVVPPLGVLFPKSNLGGGSGTVRSVASTAVL